MQREARLDAEQAAAAPLGHAVRRVAPSEARREDVDEVALLLGLRHQHAIDRFRLDAGVEERRDHVVHRT